MGPGAASPLQSPGEDVWGEDVGTDHAGGVPAVAGAIRAQPGFPPAFGLWGRGESSRRAGVCWNCLDHPLCRAVCMEGAGMPPKGSKELP